MSALTVRTDPDMACRGFHRFAALTDFIYQHCGLLREAESVRQRRAQSHHATLMLHKTAACCQHGAQNHSSTNDGFILCAWRADMRSCALDSNTMPCKAGPTFGAWSLFQFLTYRGKLIPFTEVQHT